LDPPLGRAENRLSSHFTGSCRANPRPDLRFRAKRGRLDLVPRNRLFGVIPGLFAAFFAAGSTNAETTGAITGRVTDTSGGALPGALVEATSANLQGTRAATTGAYGQFRLVALPPGSYQIRASLPGFRRASAPAAVSLDATATVNLILQPSATED